MRIPPVKIVFPESDRREILARIDQCLVSGQLTLGKNTSEFEETFVAYLGCKYAIAVNSGTSAIEIPMRIFGVQGRDILVPTNTFVATPAAVIHAGGSVRFVDADPGTLSIDVSDLKKRLTRNTAGVVVVHIGGIVTPWMGEVQRFCQEHDLFLFEDAAHAHGSSLDGKKAGTFGVAASFSFYPTKVMTSGEGGMIVTDSEKVRDEALIYRDQGKASFTSNLHTRLGYNWRMSELHAIVGLYQLQRLDGFVSDRQRVASLYDSALQGIPGLEPLLLPEGSKSNYYKYVAFLEPGTDRAALKKRLRENYQVSLSGEVYELPCHLQPIFSSAYRQGDFPKAEDLCQRHICLPLYVGMTEAEVDYVAESLRAALRSM